MKNHNRQTPASDISIVFLIIINAIVLRSGYTSNGDWYWLLLITIPVLLGVWLTSRPGNHPTSQLKTENHDKEK